MRPLTLSLAAAVGARVPHRRPAPPRCLASGWHVRHSCSDDGLAICPVCTRPVSAADDRAHPGAVRIGGHAR